MKISFEKKKGFVGITMTRDDGSIDWNKEQEQQVIHDFIHYAVETELGMKRGFYGLINEGFSIDDYEKPDDQKPELLKGKNLPLEAKQAEFIVGVVQVYLFQTGNEEELLNTLISTLDLHDVSIPAELDLHKTKAILSAAGQLLKSWGETESVLELSMQF